MSEDSATNGPREVVLVLIAGLIGFGGAWVGAHATIVTQRDQAHEARQTEARARRAKVYTTFLDQTEKYAASTRRAHRQARSFLNSLTARAGRRSLAVPDARKCNRLLTIHACFPHIDAFDREVDLGIVRCFGRRARHVGCGSLRKSLDAFDAVRIHFQAALNKVFVYGGRLGVDAAQQIARTLPPSSTFGDAADDLRRLDNTAYRTSYERFLNVMCREVSADPRPTC
jgi:hypothetical protein